MLQIHQINARQYVEMGFYMGLKHAMMEEKEGAILIVLLVILIMCVKVVIKLQLLFAIRLFFQDSYLLLLRSDMRVQP